MNLEILLKICDFLSQALGSTTEVVLHDIIEDKIIFISNGDLTGRKLGERSEPHAIKIFNERALNSNKDYLIGYRSLSETGYALRSSSLFFSDEEGQLRYTLCINQDVTLVNTLQKFLESSFGTSSITASLKPASQTIEQYTLDMIVDEVESAKPFHMDSRESKIAILRSLDKKGVFEVHGSVPKVCEVLQMAPATVYKYLKEIRSEDSEAR